MVTLTRTVRFSPGEPDGAGANGYAGSPRVRGMERYFEVLVRCRGEVDPVTGYLIDIKDVDRAVGATVIPRVTRALRERGDATNPFEVLAAFAPELARALGGKFCSVRWHLTPTYSLETESCAMKRVLLRQKFDFAAAHRLHNPSLSDEENRRLYGKCNNPRGHGHNYQFEPCVELDAGDAAAGRFSLADLEVLAKDVILDRFDHRHLNEDTLEFRQPDGLNPSVENIAMIFYGLLGPAVRGACGGASLRSITVWETDRTCCTYPA